MLSLRGAHHDMMIAIRRERQRGMDILLRQFRVIRHNFLLRHPCCKLAENIIHGDPHMPDARFASALS